MAARGPAARGTALKGALAVSPRRPQVNPVPAGRPQQPLQPSNPNYAGMLAGMTGNAAGAARNAASGASAALGSNMQRVSPGVYRNSNGQLVNSKNGNLPGQRPQQPPMMPQMPQQQMPYPQQQPQPNVWAGGTPNFNEATGQYNPQRQQMLQGFQQYPSQMQPKMAPFGYNPYPQQGPSIGDVQAAGGNTGFAGSQQQLSPYSQQQLLQEQQANNSLTRTMPDGSVVY